MKVAILSDSKSFYFKQSLCEVIKVNNPTVEFADIGANDEFANDDYEKLASVAVKFINDNPESICILIDLTGNGIAMFANKEKNVNAITCFNIPSTQSALEDYDANMFAISSLINDDDAVLIIDLILNYKNELAK